MITMDYQRPLGRLLNSLLKFEAIKYYQQRVFLYDFRPSADGVPKQEMFSWFRSPIVRYYEKSLLEMMAGFQVRLRLQMENEP